MEQDQDADGLARRAEQLVTEFFNDLALLHLRTGELAVRTIAKHSNRLSPSNVSDLLSGRRTGLPGHDVLTELVKALLHDQPEPDVQDELALWQERRVRVRTAQRAAEKAVAEQGRQLKAAAEDVLARARAEAALLTNEAGQLRRTAAEDQAQAATAAAQTVAQARAESERLREEGAQEAALVLTIAKKEALAIRAEAERIRNEALREVKRARDEALREVKRLRDDADAYVDERLANFEAVVAKTLYAVSRGRLKLRGLDPTDEPHQHAA